MFTNSNILWSLRNGALKIFLKHNFSTENCEQNEKIVEMFRTNVTGRLECVYSIIKNRHFCACHSIFHTESGELKIYQKTFIKIVLNIHSTL